MADSGSNADAPGEDDEYNPDEEDNQNRPGDEEDWEEEDDPPLRTKSGKKLPPYGNSRPESTRTKNTARRSRGRKKGSDTKRTTRKERQTAATKALHMRSRQKKAGLTPSGNGAADAPPGGEGNNGPTLGGKKRKKYKYKPGSKRRLH